LVNNPLLGDANTFLWKELVTRLNGVFCGSLQTLYNEDYSPARIRTERVSGDGSRMIDKR
jgi:hypothetical protein